MLQHVNQQLLIDTIKSLFPTYSIKTNVRGLAGVVSPNGGYLELDVWIPSLNIAFEFQDAHHYATSWYTDHSIASIQQKDNIKKLSLEKRGENLFVIPCWWNGTTESLVATIRKQRPDLLMDHPQSPVFIPSEPPQGFFAESKIPFVGELMLASFPANSLFDPTSWFVSEKYDGVRAFASTQLYSRQGRVLAIPQQFLQFLPNSHLDGEIWFGRNSFQLAQHALFSQHSRSTDLFWDSCRYCVFDYFHATDEFENRFFRLLDFISFYSPFIIPISHVVCPSAKFQRNFIESIQSAGGEGIVMRKPKSLYTKGRSEDLIKIKEVRDEEGLVVEVLSQGTYKLKLAGEAITATLSPNFEPPLPKLGDVVSFSFVNFSTKGNPTHVQITRVREEFKLAAENEKDREQKPFGYWTKNGNSNIKLFFDEFAKKRGLDPRDPETWYPISKKHIISEEGGGSVIHHYGFTVVRALMDVYPDIGLQEHKFAQMRKKYWLNLDNHRDFFNRFAAKHNFDPLIPRNWYNINKKTILGQGGGRLLYLYNNSLPDALLHVYPDIGLNKDSFL